MFILCYCQVVLTAVWHSLHLLKCLVVLAFVTMSALQLISPGLDLCHVWRDVFFVGVLTFAAYPAGIWTLQAVGKPLVVAKKVTWKKILHPKQRLWSHAEKWRSSRVHRAPNEVMLLFHCGMPVSLLESSCQCLPLLLNILFFLKVLVFFQILKQRAEQFLPQIQSWEIAPQSYKPGCCVL